jgi:hypothetical protein
MFHVEDFIPAIGPTLSDHPDAIRMRQAPRSIEAPREDPSAEFDAERKTVVIRFNRNSVKQDFVRDTVQEYGAKHGTAKIAFVELLICQKVMLAEGPSLTQLGFDHVIAPEHEAVGLFCWRRAVKWKKKSVEPKVSPTSHRE